ncbi:MAG: hypothetical protein P4L40_04605, partial [Terracidiphilus sp.]|nr:hypothetical protein [Terracidiphilus sp.]
ALCSSSARFALYRFTSCLDAIVVPLRFVVNHEAYPNPTSDVTKSLKQGITENVNSSHAHFEYVEIDSRCPPQTAVLDSKACQLWCVTHTSVPTRSLSVVPSKTTVCKKPGMSRPATSSWPICLVNLLRSVQAAPLAGTVLSRRGMQKLKLVLWRAETPGTAQRCGV